MDPKGVFKRVKAKLYVSPDWKTSSPQQNDEGNLVLSDVEIVTLNNGTQYTVVLRPNGEPFHGTDEASTLPNSRRVDEKQREEWDRRTPPQGKPTSRQGGRRWGWNPESRQYDIDQGAVQIETKNVQEGGKWYAVTTEDGEVTSKKEIEPPGAANTNQPPQEKDEGGTRYVWQNGKWVPVGPAPPNPAERAIETQRQTNEIAQAKLELEKDKHTQEKIKQALELKKPTFVNTSDGRTLLIRPNADGTDYTIEDQTRRTKLPEELAGWKPDINKPGLGLYEYRDLVDRLVREGKMDAADVKSVLERAHSEATLIVNQAGVVIGNQTAVRNQDINQRSQDITNQGNLASAATSGAQLAEKWAESAVPKLDPGGNPGGSAFTDAMDLARLNVERYGGLGTPERVALPPALSQLQRMDVSGAPAQGPGPSGQAAVAGLFPTSDGAGQRPSVLSSSVVPGATAPAPALAPIFAPSSSPQPLMDGEDRPSSEAVANSLRSTVDLSSARAAIERRARQQIEDGMDPAVVEHVARQQLEALGAA